MIVTESDQSFEKVYVRWMEPHLKWSKGERKRKLSEGLGFAEKLFVRSVLWPALSNLENVHPEFEVRDFKDGVRFLDFALLLNGQRICIEVDAFSTHYRDLNRRQFADQLTRQNHLVIDGWHVLRFSLDDIKENPRSCQQLLLHALGKWGLESKEAFETENPIDLAILKLMRTRDAPVSPTQVALELGWHRVTTATHMRSLLDQGYLVSTSAGKKRIKRYRLNPDHHNVRKP
jgi:very-short-patch-repair endonuclease/biotin operon repressor